jgi:uncharacterized damage-inducible protein DinB
MPAFDPKDDLRYYLDDARNALLWKLEGVSEHDARRPLTPTGTNLLGLVKHTAGTEAGYLGEVFDRPFPEDLPWMAETAEPNADMWATADESRQEIVALYRRVWVHSDATVEALELDATGRVPWWRPDRQVISLHRVLVHVIAETHRHAGQADIVRELVDGAAGWRRGSSNLPSDDPSWWSAYRDRLTEVARQFRDG